MPSFGTYQFFPPVIEEGSTGREWNTKITLTKGRESRNAEWSEGRWRFQLGGLKFLPSQMDDWDAFVDVLEGAHKPFLMRLNSARFELNEGVIGTGTGVATAFQLKKVRSRQGASKTENILFPHHDYPPQEYGNGGVALATEYVRVWKNGIEQVLGTNFTVQREGGIITFTTPPANGAVITATCKYWVLVRFEQDFNPVGSKGGKTYEIPSGVAAVQPKGGI